VNKIKAKYDDFMKSEYALDDAVEKCFTKTNKLDHLVGIGS
jgi:hypothetical protein